MTACTSNKDIKRNVSSDDRSEEQAAKDYWSKRGKDWSKFGYDGYTGKKNKLKFVGAVGSVKNVKYALELSGRRDQLLEENLFDTGISPNGKTDCEATMKRVHRSAYGDCYFHNHEEHLTDKDKNLTNQLRMGAVHERFGRNTPTDKSNDALKSDLMNPSPMEISSRLLSRNGKQVDAPVINVLATAWLQAMNHDWFTHGKNSKKKSYDIKGHHFHKELAQGMKLPATQSESEKENIKCGDYFNIAGEEIYKLNEIIDILTSMSEVKNIKFLSWTNDNKKSLTIELTYEQMKWNKDGNHTFEDRTDVYNKVRLDNLNYIINDLENEIVK